MSRVLSVVHQAFNSEYLLLLSERRRFSVFVCFLQFIPIMDAYYSLMYILSFLLRIHSPEVPV